MSLQMLKDPNSSQIHPIKNIIAIAAGKGGVGKSTVTVNLALALKQLGFSVGILDSDIYGPSIRKMLPEESLPIQKEKMIIPAFCSGIKMISMAFFRKNQEASIVRAPIANGIITQFIKNIEWGSLDFLLIDFPPGTGDIQLTLSQKAMLSGAIMVTTPQDVAVMDVRKAMDMFYQVNVPIIGIVENMSYYYHEKTEEKLYLFGKDGGTRLAAETQTYLLAQIPIDPILSQNEDRGKTLFSGNLSKLLPIEDSFTQLAHKLISISLNLSNKIFIKKFEQKDAHRFIIEWPDGSIDWYQLNFIQENCPCANCTEKKEGLRMVDQQVKATQITQVGRYGLKIDFTSGCSKGIYQFDYLKKLSLSGKMS